MNSVYKTIVIQIQIYRVKVFFTVNSVSKQDKAIFQLVVTFSLVTVCSNP